MGQHKTNLNSQLASAGKLAKPANEVKPLHADICMKHDSAQVVIIYNQKVENALYTLPQLAHHIGGLVGAARMIDPTFMADEIKLP